MGFNHQALTKTKLRRVFFFVVAVLGVAVFLALMVRYQFLFMRYYFEYYFEVAKWHLNSECKVSQDASPQMSKIIPNSSWEDLISHQLTTVHDRWVISKPDVGLGLCNRILNTLSAMMFAMATNRTFWIEWEQQEAENITANEYAGMSSYDDLFVSELHDRRFRPPTSLIEGARRDHKCFFEKVRFSRDLNRDFSDRAIRIEGGEWWGPLLIRNRAYGNTIFNGLKPMDGFSILFRAMFTLHPPRIEPEKCSWMIQYRTIWPPPRYTAPIESFLSCAQEKGLAPADYSTTWIVTDDPVALLAHATPEAARTLSAMHLPRERSTCRGPCGDRKAMETMHRLSRCRNVVLTHGSSFGSCIAGLAGARRQFRVSHYGECLDPRTRDADGPIDANTYSRMGNIATYLAQRSD